MLYPVYLCRMNKRTIAFHHFGCKVNFAETSTLSRQFQEKGFEILDFHLRADIYVISTCVVTAIAEKKCRAAIRQAHKLNPQAIIAVIGCFPELKPAELLQMEGVDLVLGHEEKFELFNEIEKLDHTDDYHGRLACEKKTPSPGFVPSFSYGDHTRSFLKIQDGCDYYCSYCTIPFARGHSRSDTIENVLNNVGEIIRHNIKEIVLTGVNIGDFGRHQGETFASLIKALDKAEGISRFRISSIEPDLLNDEIIQIVASSDTFLPHFHIPLQSGSDKVLKAMHRKYTTSLFASRVNKIKSLMPYACIAADVIVGFPGESEEDFREMVDFIQATDLSYLHVFSFSKRENTLAAKMDFMIPEQVKRERSQILHTLSNEKKKDFYHQNQGRIENVLFESDNSGGFMHGFSGNYLRVKTPFQSNLINQIKKVILKKVDDDGTFLINIIDDK